MIRKTQTDQPMLHSFLHVVSSSTASMTAAHAMRVQILSLAHGSLASIVFLTVSMMLLIMLLKLSFDVNGQSRALMIDIEHLEPELVYFKKIWGASRMTEYVSSGKKPVQDKRVKKTKKLLYQALVTLLNEQPLEKITVSDICRNANINRNTFYYHYASVQELHHDVLENVLQDIRNSSLDDQGKQLSSQELRDDLANRCRVLGKHAEILRLLMIDHTDAAFQQALLDINHVRYEQSILEESHGKASDAQVRFVLDYIHKGSVAVMCAWIREGMQQTPEEIADLLFQLAVAGPKEYLRGL